MSQVPDHIKAMKPPSSEVQLIKGHYYVYAVKSRYDKTKKRSYSDRQGCIGQIYAGVGFVPNGAGRSAVLSVTKEYGASRAITALTAGLLEKLRKHFPSDFLRIYVLAALKLLDKGLTTRRVDWAYERSALSLILPEVHLSKNTLTEFVTGLSLRRGDMVGFMREFQTAENHSSIVDGSSFLSDSLGNPYCERGYSPGNRNKTQIRLIYSFERETRRPNYFDVVPGSVTDMAAFISCFGELGLSNSIVVLDNGFFSDSNIKALLAADGMRFIIPLKGNTVLADKKFKPFSAYKDVIGNNFSYHNRFIFFREIECAKYGGCKVFIYYDESRNRDLEKERIKKAQQLVEGSLPQDAVARLHKECEMLGVTMLLTNSESDAERTYLDYKARWLIEELFDTMKVTLSFNMNYETRYETMMGWAFIEFVSLQMYYEIDRVLNETGLYRNYNVGDMLHYLKAIEQSNCNADGSWKISNLSDKRREVLDKLGITLEPIQSRAGMG